MRAREDNLRRKKDEKRKERTVTIDLVGRRVIDDQPAVVDVYEEARLEEDRRAAEATAAAANLPNLFGQNNRNSEAGTKYRVHAVATLSPHYTLFFLFFSFSCSRS